MRYEYQYQASEVIGNLLFWSFLSVMVLLGIILAGVWLGNKIREHRHNERERRKHRIGQLEGTLPGMKIVSLHWRPGWHEGGFVKAWVPVAGKDGDRALCRLDYVRKGHRLMWRHGLPSFELDCNPTQLPCFVTSMGRTRRLQRRLKRLLCSCRVRVAQGWVRTIRAGS